MTNLDSILKSRDITLTTKFRLVKAMVFPVDMYGCESWTKKKAEHWRIDAVELWCWRRLLRVPWTARRSNHSEGDQPWDFFGRNDAKAETPVLWPPHAKSWLIGKTIALTRWTFVGKVMSLLLNMLSRLVITFLPRSKCLLISWLQSPSAVILEPKK